MGTIEITKAVMGKMGMSLKDVAEERRSIGNDAMIEKYNLIQDDIKLYVPKIQITIA